MTRYWLDIDRECHGPYTPEEIVSLLETGQAQPTTLAAAEGTEAWTPLSQLFDLRPVAPPAVAAAPVIVPAAIAGPSHPSLPVKKPGSGWMPLIVIAVVLFVLAAGTLFVLFPMLQVAANRARLSQDLSNMRQVKFALDGFATDFDGRYPNSHTHQQVWHEDLQVPAPQTSNDYFRQLFPSGQTRNEGIFWVRNSTVCKADPPDEDLGAGSTYGATKVIPEKVLAQGDCGLAYILDQSDQSPVERILFLSAYRAGSTEFDRGLYSGTRSQALVARIDGSIKACPLKEGTLPAPDDDGRDWLEDAKCWEGAPPRIVQPTQ